MPLLQAEHLDLMAYLENIVHAIWNGPVPALEQQNLFYAPNLAPENFEKAAVRRCRV